MGKAAILRLAAVQCLSMSPYLITILVLVLMSADRSRAAPDAPADPGRNFQAPR